MIIKVPDQLILDALAIKESNVENRGLHNNYHKRWSIDRDNPIKKYFGDLNFLHGTILWHNSPYPVHTDVWHPENKTNVLIPLMIENSQKFFVFDQTFNGSCQWVLSYGQRDKDSPDQARTMRPCEDDRIKNLTDLPLDQEMCQYLPEEPEFYHGLSGEMYDYKPGVGFAFGSDHLHATGVMKGTYKTAMALWFANNISEIVSEFNRVNNV
jgi:hypothetical protein